MLVSLKAEVLEAWTFPPETGLEESLEDGFEAEDSPDWGTMIPLPRRPERHLRRRPVAPPPLQRPVTLGELIRQLEEIAERLEQEGEAPARQRQRNRRYSDRMAIEQVANLAHREKLPETTAGLQRFLSHWSLAADWLDFELLVTHWPGPWSRIPPPKISTATGWACSGRSCSSPPRETWNWSSRGPVRATAVAAPGSGASSPADPAGDGRLTPLPKVCSLMDGDPRL